eukprot:scaffold21472_cov81-Isochrysis_galbana.AAC.2
MTHPRPMAMPGRPHPQPQPSHQASQSGPRCCIMRRAGRLESPSGGTPATRPAATACVAPPPWAPPLQRLTPPWPPPSPPCAPPAFRLLAAVAPPPPTS